MSRRLPHGADPMTRTSLPLDALRSEPGPQPWPHSPSCLGSGRPLRRSLRVGGGSPRRRSPGAPSRWSSPETALCGPSRPPLVLRGAAGLVEGRSGAPLSHRNGGGWRNGGAVLATVGLADPSWRPCGMRSGRGPVGGVARALAGMRRLQGVIRMIVRRKMAPFR